VQSCDPTGLAARLGAKYGVEITTITRAVRLCQLGTPELIEAVIRGDVKISSAAQAAAAHEGPAQLANARPAVRTKGASPERQAALLADVAKLVATESKHSGSSVPECSGADRARDKSAEGGGDKKSATAKSGKDKCPDPIDTGQARDKAGECGGRGKKKTSASSDAEVKEPGRARDKAEGGAI